MYSDENTTQYNNEGTAFDVISSRFLGINIDQTIGSTTPLGAPSALDLSSLERSQTPPSAFHPLHLLFFRHIWGFRRGTRRSCLGRRNVHAHLGDQPHYGCMRTWVLHAVRKGARYPEAPISVNQCHTWETR